MIASSSTMRMGVLLIKRFLYYQHQHCRDVLHASPRQRDAFHASLQNINSCRRRDALHASRFRRLTIETHSMRLYNKIFSISRRDALHASQYMHLYDTASLGLNANVNSVPSPPLTSTV